MPAEHFLSRVDVVEEHRAEASQRGNSKVSGQARHRLTKQRQTTQAKVDSDARLSSQLVSRYECTLEIAVL